MMMFYPISLLCRLFMAFMGQPRLGIVTRTIYEGMTDIFHFLVVFVSFLLAWCCYAMILFGAELEQYSTMSRAMVSCIRMLFMDVDWHDMRNSQGFVRACTFYVG